MGSVFLFANIGVALAILALTLSAFRRGGRHGRSWVFFAAASIGLALNAVSDTLGVPFLGQVSELVFTSLLAVGFAFLYGQDRDDMERAEELAATDPLTSLYNMRAFREQVGARIDETRRHAGRCAVAILDLDEFKALNDTQGHAAGDRVLQLVATATRSGLRPHDIAARYGGDEFVLFLDRCDAAEAKRVVRRITTSVNALSDAVRGGVTVSAGVASFPAHGSDLATLLEAADAVLLEIKRTGRNDVRTADVA